MATTLQLLIFDVNETLLDLSLLKRKINTFLKSEFAFQDWFSKLIQFAMVEALTESYSDFGEIGSATLKMTAESFLKTFSEEKIKTVLSIITQLQPHFDVRKGLKLLKSKGI